MESSFLPLELVYEHRNYLPNIGIIVLIAYILISSNTPQEMTETSVVTG
jgi:hypothetical protein